MMNLDGGREQTRAVIGGDKYEQCEYQQRRAIGSRSDRGKVTAKRECAYVTEQQQQPSRKPASAQCGTQNNATASGL